MRAKLVHGLIITVQMVADEVRKDGTIRDGPTLLVRTNTTFYPLTDERDSDGRVRARIGEDVSDLLGRGARELDRQTEIINRLLAESDHE